MPWRPRDRCVLRMGVLPHVLLSVCPRGVFPHAFASRGAPPPRCGNHSAEYVLRRCITNSRAPTVKYARAAAMGRETERAELFSPSSGNGLGLHGWRGGDFGVNPREVLVVRCAFAPRALSMRAVSRLPVTAANDSCRL